MEARNTCKVGGRRTPNNPSAPSADGIRPNSAAWDSPEAEPEPYRLGGLAIHYEERRVSVAGRPVQLTATEYELLRVLSRNAGRVSTYEALLRQVWGGRHNGDTELVRTFVKKLRRKLGDDAASPAYIVNERGVGYRMARPGDA